MNKDRRNLLILCTATVLFFVVITGVGIGTSMDRYTVTVEVSPDIYTVAIDPNAQKDPIWGITPLAPEAWKDNFGHTERTQLFFTCNELVKAVVILEKRLAALESLHNKTSPTTHRIDPDEKWIGPQVDPNEVVE